MFRLKLIPVLTGIVIGAWLTSVAAAEPAAPKPDKLCLALMRIDNIDIMDNRNIVFETVNGEYYLNKLPYSCVDMNRDDAILYKTSLSELCNLDIIHVLDSIGGGFHDDGACGLGKFKRITKADYQSLAHRSAEK